MTALYIGRMSARPSRGLRLDGARGRPFGRLWDMTGSSRYTRSIVVPRRMMPYSISYTSSGTGRQRAVSGTRCRAHAWRTESRAEAR